MAGIKIRITIAIGPPKAGIIDGKRRDIVLGDTNRSLIPSTHPDSLAERDVSRHDCTLNLKVAIFRTRIHNVG